ncbi:hypothetical protein [Legionella jordanis]|uniref:Transmembrane protein n=1 Tax=Legionella jordanis TaxID=456 RepID=A0A0W0V9J0_9GAMM|nr:hypothetical protein [Legionella jordanis]KTD16541.1 hypothetical protein Ljor_0847 [Legionella jordanis]RMX03919.1 hypothetical protein EAW55_06055 [Legionella jordanis]RMX22015.1 hypothetical protein EAS68_00355 [Legionella jordanis]VEH11997.1 Uncharacterised protein [Legionella jordanis]HAT8712699.1 hypothetical protein [Legionella jordanis]
MVNETIHSPTHPTLPHEHHHHCAVHPFKRVSWTAIFAGALVGVGLGFLLNVFGFAIGLSAFTLNNQGATVLAIGGLIGIIIAVVVSMVVAGYTAGYLGRLYCPQRNLGILYGFLTWSVALILSAILAGHVSNFVGGYTNAATNSVNVSSQNANTVTPQITAQNQNASGNTNVNVNASPRSLAWAAFIIFILFFIGAVSTCFGAHWGMSCRRED